MKCYEAFCGVGEVSVDPREGGKPGEGCGNDGLEEAGGKPLAEVMGADLRVVVFHRLPPPLETSANGAELSTFPQPRRKEALGDKLAPSALYANHCM
jgi:hypothetical protein